MDTPESSRPVGTPKARLRNELGERAGVPLIGPHASAAEIDAGLLADLRQWHARQSPEHLATRGARLTGEELDLLLRIADERDDLRGDEPATERHAPRDYAAFDPFGDFTLEPGRVHDPYAEPTEPAPADDFPCCGRAIEPEIECTHDESTIANGGLVCGACGKLLAWIIFKRPSA